MYILIKTLTKLQISQRSCMRCRRLFLGMLSIYIYTHAKTSFHARPAFPLHNFGYTNRRPSKPVANEMDAVKTEPSNFLSTLF